MGSRLGTFRTPLALGLVFIALLAVFAITPDPDRQNANAVVPTAEPTAGPGECVVCPIDQECDPGTNQCRFIDHTPWPCVSSARFDDRAGQCLPEGAPPPPPAPVVRQPAEPEPEPQPDRPPGPIFPPGIGGDSDSDPPAIGD